MKLRSAQKKGDRQPPNSNDYISKMPDDVLVMILSRLTVKDAVVTGSLSARWKHLWHNLTQLNFDGTEILTKTANYAGLYFKERVKFLMQVNNVIRSHNHPVVQRFRVRFDLDLCDSQCINEWIRFALDKKVERLELNFLDKSRPTCYTCNNYNFTLPSSNATCLTLKKLVLLGVNLNEPTLNEILKNSPHLNILSVSDSRLFPHIRVGGRGINLNYLKIMGCSGIESISLYDLDLETLVHCGHEVEFYLTDLPKIKKLDIGEVSVGLEKNVFKQISSCAPYLQVLILDMWRPQKSLDVNVIPKFPNVKLLTLVMRAKEDDCLLEFTSIAQACPKLETFTISLNWLSPWKRWREVKRVVAPEGHKHLQNLEIFGYYGRISDLELAVYAIDNAVALKKISIVPGCHAFEGKLSKLDCLKTQIAGRSSAKRQITPLLPPGVDLVIL